MLAGGDGTQQMPLGSDSFSEGPAVRVTLVELTCTFGACVVVTWPEGLGRNAGFLSHLSDCVQGQRPTPTPQPLCPVGSNEDLGAILSRKSHSAPVSWAGCCGHWEETAAWPQP